MRIQPKTVCIFEDDQYFMLFPLTYLRPVFQLHCGALSLAERIRRFFPDSAIVYQCRDYLAPLLTENSAGIRVNQMINEDCLFINGSVLCDQRFVDSILQDAGCTYTHNNKTVAFWNRLTTSKKEIDVQCICYPWDLIQHNAEALKDDFEFTAKKIDGRVYEGVHLVESEKISIGNNSKIKPGVVLDAEHGPIIIGENVTIMSNAVIEGPCYVGNNSIIKAGAKIYEGTSIGPTCKVGGEIEASIMHGYSNKQHDGFLGHSYIAEWCNLGADTNTSDLKNNYSSIKVIINGETYDSGLLFIGLIMGDHSKSGINTMFNTGTVVGVSSNIFGAGFPPKYIPSFSWADGTDIKTYRIDKALDVARTVMDRRKITLTPAYQALLQYIFEMTTHERTS
ncbi:GlmU family protein [bacterium]|nr:GlmU family protein [bacterium]